MHQRTNEHAQGATVVAKDPTQEDGLAEGKDGWAEGEVLSCLCLWGSHGQSVSLSHHYDDDAGWSVAPLWGGQSVLQVQ